MIFLFVWTFLVTSISNLIIINASSDDELCLPALRDSSNLTIFRDQRDKIDPDVVSAHPGFSLFSSYPILPHKSTNAKIHRTKRRALDLKTKEASEKPTCQKNAGAYGQEERQGMKAVPKLTSTQVFMFFSLIIIC